MKTTRTFCPAALALLLSLGWSARAQDDVTIPKSRLEELERKEKELEKLKGDLNQTKDENRQLKKQKEEAVKSSSIEPLKAPVTSHVSPPLAALPQLAPGTVIESMDLANYYAADPTAADAHFRSQQFTVRGEIAGFQSLLFRRNYRVVLQTPDNDTRVICDLLPPDKATAVYPAKNGSELVVAYGDAQSTLVKLGQTVQVTGVCKGLKDHAVMIYARALFSVPNRAAPK